MLFRSRRQIQHHQICCVFQGGKQGFQHLSLIHISKRIRGIDAFDKIYNVNSRQVINFGGNLNLFESELKAYDRKGYDITIVAGSEERLSNLKDLASRMGLEEKITFARGTLTAGIDFPEEKRCWISENDIFKYSKKDVYKRQGQLSEPQA